IDYTSKGNVIELGFVGDGVCMLINFFFQAEDGIRDGHVTGVQTCALPISLFNKLLPKDVPFTDMESSGVWTPAGLPMQIFSAMGERERTIEPRVDDDFEMMGMQFRVIVHARDRKSTRLNSSHVAISYAVFCVKKKKLTMNFI